MYRSLLTQSTVKDLLAIACQQKEQDGQVMPAVLLLENRVHLRVLELPDLADDALVRRAQFHALGKQFPRSCEAVFVAESWLAPADSPGAPIDHPNRQEAIMISGRNRDNTRGMFVTQVFTTQDDRIIWQEPHIAIKPGIVEGIVDCIFAP